MPEIDRGFEPKEVEERLYRFWYEKGYFMPQRDASQSPYSIVIPPPNVTGSLHMGHALNATLQDIIIRWKRMLGYKTLWIPGTDHAGIATQNVVERLIAKEGLTRHMLGRDLFLKRIWQWKEQSGTEIINQLKRLGASCDWSRERFTMDEGLSRAVREAFVRLYNDGLIYRDYRLINWCPRCQTALSDLEVEYEELDGRLYYIKYPLSDNGDYIRVATTRPETMLGDTAVAINPEDERYKGLAGKKVILPLTKREIPLIQDKEVEIEFGTGAVKVTPAHDFTDEATGKRHNLPSIIVINRYGKMTENAGERYKDLDRFEARKRIIEDLKREGYLEKEERYRHSVGHCYRCKTIIEPLPTIQWYIKIKPLAEPAINTVREGRIRLIPETWLNSYYSWMENIKDWCISRQIWWGHRIPAWYCPECKDSSGRRHGERIFITLKEPLVIDGTSIKRLSYSLLKDKGMKHDEILSSMESIEIDKDIKPIVSITDIQGCPECNALLIQDPDVLDTWFSSSLWPFSTLGWPDMTEDLKTYYPTSVLVTAFDILFFWVARMIMMGLRFMNDVPFRDVYIHAIVRDEKGQKMSKSKGNVVDPLIMMDKYGTDAFRFTLAAFAAQGRDIRFSEERLEGYRHFINKLWNAGRFIRMNTEDIKDTPSRSEIDKIRADLDIPSRWILHRLSITIDNVQKALENYRFNDAAGSIYQFIWHEFCDWYLEFSKTYLYEKSENAENTKKILLFILDTALRLLHPFMPFVTEEMWQKILLRKDSIMKRHFPEKIPQDQEAEDTMSYIMDAVTGARNIRGELNIPPSKEINLLIKPENESLRDLFEKYFLQIKRLTRASQIRIDDTLKRPMGSAISVKKGFELYIPLEGLIDVDAELRRLKKEDKNLIEEINLKNKKLMNEDFLKKAPPHIVEKEKREYRELIEKRKKLLDSIKMLEEVM